MSMPIQFMNSSIVYADWAGIKDFLNNVDFYQLFFNNNSSMSVVDSFYYILYSCIELFVPCKRIAMNNKMQHIHIVYAD
jgi:hypothetical protein